MDAIRVPVSEMDSIRKAKESIGQGRTPVTVWGAAENVRPLVTEALREDAEQVLIVTYDDA